MGKETTQDELKAKNKLKKAMSMWANGDASLINEMKRSGEVSKRQLDIQKTRYPKLDGKTNPLYEKPIKQQMSRLTIEGALSVWSDMTDNEKKANKADIRKKYYNMLARQDKSPNAKKEIKEKMVKAGLL